MHIYACIYTYKYRHVFVFHKPLLSSCFQVNHFFLFSFTLTFLSAVSVPKKVALTNTSKAYLCSLSFSVHKRAFAYKILTNDWSLVSLLKILWLLFNLFLFALSI